MSLNEFVEIDENAPICPQRGCRGRRMTNEEVKASGCLDYIVQPDASAGEYWACCISVCNEWIHMPHGE